jgi:hypothetical protein
MAVRKPNKSGNSGKQKYELPQAITERLKAGLTECIEHGRASVGAEATIRGELDHGAPQTHVALASLYGFGHEVLKLAEKERTSWFSSQEYERKDGKKLKVPYHKPAKENCFIALTKLAFPRCEDGTRSRYATILFGALATEIPVERFPQWLASVHNVGTPNESTGVKGAYLAHKKTRPPPKDDKGDVEPDWSQVSKVALRRSVAIEWPRSLHVEATFKGGFFVLVGHRDEDGSTASICTVDADEAFVAEALIRAAAGTEEDKQGKRASVNEQAQVVSVRHHEAEADEEQVA